MSSFPLTNEHNNDFTFEEVSEVKKDKKNISATGFERAYENFRKTLPIMLENKELFKHFGLERAEHLPCNCEAYIAKKIRWKENNYRLRIVFRVIGGKILIIEIYFKGQQNNENKERICKYC